MVQCQPSQGQHMMAAWPLESGVSLSINIWKPSPLVGRCYTYLPCCTWMVLLCVMYTSHVCILHIWDLYRFVSSHFISCHPHIQLMSCHPHIQFILYHPCTQVVLSLSDSDMFTLVSAHPITRANIFGAWHISSRLPDQAHMLPGQAHMHWPI